VNLEYYTSERFIHDDLAKKAAVALSTLQDTWNEDGKIDPFAISWVQETVHSDAGRPIDRFVLVDLPQDRAQWSGALVATVQKTKPYALLVCEQKEDEVVAIFESQHGSRSWRYPIKSHGRVKLLGDPSTRDDVDSIGILWRAKKAQA
jgi:hypothetical protein